MEKVINLGIPHIGELIFESFDTPELLQCLLVSETWKVIAENVLIKKWKGKIFEACKQGETKVVQLLLEHSESETMGLNTTSEHGVNAFGLACYNGHKDVVQLLLDRCEDKNINLNASNINGGTAFRVACQGGHKDIVKLLLNHPITENELNARNNNGDTAFIMACYKGHKDVVQFLLDHIDRG